MLTFPRDRRDLLIVLKAENLQENRGRGKQILLFKLTNNRKKHSPLQDLSYPKPIEQQQKKAHKPPTPQKITKTQC